jgi:hypothetical protein
MKSVQFESISFPKISINIPFKTQIFTVSYLYKILKNTTTLNRSKPSTNKRQITQIYLLLFLEAILIYL